MACWSLTVRACRVVAVVALSIASTGCRTAAPLPVYGTVPDFELTAQTGAKFPGSSLTGNVWVAEFFFTHCPGPCPRMNARFQQIAKRFESRNDVKLVSFTVDPARDTPDVLAAYSHKFSAKSSRWFFLTGPLDRLNDLGRNVFMLGEVTGNLDHSTRFVLVDRKRRIRGFYHSNDSQSVQQLVRDIQWLLRERT